MTIVTPHRPALSRFPGRAGGHVRTRSAAGVARPATEPTDWLPDLAELLTDDVATFHERLAQASGVSRLTIDAPARSVTVDDRPVHLTAKEFDLLVHLARSSGRTVTRDELLTSVWDRATVQEGSRTVDVHVRRVREKLDVGHVITTVRGVGYRFATNAVVALQA